MVKNKKPVINFIDKQMIKSMTGEEERREYLVSPKIYLTF